MASVEPPRPDLFAPPTAGPPPMSEAQADEVALGRSGASTLLAVAVIELAAATLVLFVMNPRPPAPIEVAVAYGLVAAFFALAFWARQSPYPALITGLGLFVALNVPAAIVDPSALLQGALLKVIVVGLLANGVRNIHVHRRISRMQLG